MGNISNSKKRRVFDIIQIGQEDDILSRAFDIFITIVIVLNIIVLFLETFDTFNAYKHIFSIIEIVTTIIFIGEYVLRIWTAEFLYPNLKKWQATLRFLVSTDGIIILLSILPFFFLSGFVVFRMLRVARIFIFSESTSGLTALRSFIQYLSIREIRLSPVSLLFSCSCLRHRSVCTVQSMKRSLMFSKMLFRNLVERFCAADRRVWRYLSDYTIRTVHGNCDFIFGRRSSCYSNRYYFCRLR